MTDFWYNMSAVAADDTLGLMQNVDSILFFHLFGALFLIVLFIILYRSFVGFNNNPKVSLMYTAFFIAILSIILKLLSLVNDYAVFIAWGIFAISAALQFILD